MLDDGFFVFVAVVLVWLKITIDEYSEIAPDFIWLVGMSYLLLFLAVLYFFVRLKMTEFAVEKDLQEIDNRVKTLLDKINLNEKMNLGVKAE
jgi:uncharacterized membrane protein